MNSIDLRIGPPVTGKNFYQRPALIAKLLRALKRGHVAFLGPRRTGKTSCLEEIKANPDGFIPILLNLERCREIFLSLKDESFVRVIDSRGTLDEVAAMVREAVGSRLL